MSPCDSCGQPAVGRFSSEMKRPGKRAVRSIPNALCHPCVERIRGIGLRLVAA